jgi:hypothetical protein
VGIILDQIYDKEAVGVLSIGEPKAASAEITGSTDDKLAADNGDQVKVPNVNQTGEFTEPTHNLGALKTLSVGDEIVFDKGIFAEADYKADGNNYYFPGTVLNEDQNVMICSKGSASGNSTAVNVGSGFVQVNRYNSESDANGNPAPSIAIKVTRGMQLKISAYNTGSNIVRPLDIIADASGTSVMSGDDIKTSYAQTDESGEATGKVVVANENSENEAEAAGSAGLRGIWYGQKAGNNIPSHTVTVNADGIVYIVSRNSNIRISSIEVVSDGTTTGE